MENQNHAEFYGEENTLDPGVSAALNGTAGQGFERQMECNVAAYEIAGEMKRLLENPGKALFISTTLEDERN